MPSTNGTGGEHSEIVQPSTRRRGGRPPASRAGEVDGRILDVASHLFLARGLEGTSCDQVAALARAGKASIYARYPNKEALFAAVVRREAERRLVASQRVPPDLPIGDRLVAVGTDVVEHALGPGAVALMRLIVAEAAQMPELAAEVDAIGRQGWIGRVAEVIAGRSSSAEAIARATVPAAKFIELVVPPLLIGALLGDDVGMLRASVPSRIEAATVMLTATGWLDGWS